MRTETLKVAGMTCGGCVSSVTNALKAVDGVSAVAVSLQAGEARVEFNENATSPERLRAAIQQAGFNAEERIPAHHAKHGCCG